MPPASRRSTSHSSRCPRGSAMWRGTTPPLSRLRSTRASPPCCWSQCRARRAVLEVTEEEDVQARAMAAGNRLAKALEALPGVTGVRGLGLLMAVELKSAGSAKEVAAAALEASLVVNPVTDSALRLAPS